MTTQSYTTVFSLFTLVNTLLMAVNAVTCCRLLPRCCHCNFPRQKISLLGGLDGSPVTEIGCCRLITCIPWILLLKKLKWSVNGLIQGVTSLAWNGNTRRSWNEVKGIAGDRNAWKIFVDALCSTRSKLIMMMIYEQKPIVTAANRVFFIWTTWP